MQKEPLKVALIQSDLYWQDVTANLAMLEEKIAMIPEADVMVLPEMFNSGFSMDVTVVSEPPNLTTTRWMKQMAAQYSVLLIGSIAVRDGGKYYNRLLCVYPDGRVQSYDKRHLFSPAGEDKFYTAGSEWMTISWCGWTIRPLICYDLRFPVWSRNRVANLYDLLIYVASWPASRAPVWSALLMARAIENQSYVIGVNRIGLDGLGVRHSGYSQAINYSGELLLSLESKNATAVVSLSADQLLEFREGFPAWQDADAFDFRN